MPPYIQVECRSWKNRGYRTTECRSLSEDNLNILVIPTLAIDTASVHYGSNNAD